MKPQSKTAVKGDTTSKHFNDVLRALVVALDTLYKNNAPLVITLIFIVLICFYVLVRAINITYIYSLVVTLLFVLLSISLYVKDKNSLNSIFTFSLGIFTAFTVTWNAATFSIFFIGFIMLVVSIFFIASIRAAATVEEKLTTAANSYISDFETNKKTLQEVVKTASKQGGLLSIMTIWEATLFFAYQKVPKNHMIALIDALNQIYTVTKVDTESLLILLNNINHLSPTEDSLLINLTTLKHYVIKGKSTPSNLVNILNDTLHIAIENNIDFVVFTAAILSYLSYGYTQQRIAEKLEAKYSNVAG